MKKEKYQEKKCGQCSFFKNCIPMPGGTLKCMSADGKLISDRFSKACHFYKKENTNRQEKH